MKKLLAVILSLTLALSFAACSSGNTDSSDAAQTTTAEPTAAQTTAAEPAAVAFSDEMTEKLDKVLTQKSFEGIVYLTQNGSVVYQSATGKDETGADLTVDSTMYIASISKQFCAAAILSLRDQGKLSVDDTLDKYFPEYSNGKDITIKNLLTMRSGVPDFATYTGDDISPDKTEEENSAITKEWFFSQPLEFEPDSTFKYCNFNYFLLSDIVAQVSEQDYHDFIRSNFFEPLGMTHTGFVSEVKDSPQWANGLTYAIFTEGNAAEGQTNSADNVASNAILTNGSADIASNAPDMDKWMTGLSGGKVISPDSYREMTADYSPDFAGGYGYGMFVSFYGGVGHSGLIGSYNSIDYINEKNGYNLFIANNTSYKNLDSLTQAIMDVVTGK